MPNPIARTVTVQAAAGDAIFNLELDANAANNAPSYYLSGWQAAANALSAAIADPITINLEIGYGEYPGDNSGENSQDASAAPVVGASDSYLQLKSLLISNGSSDVVNALGHLPNTTTLNGQGSFSITAAEAKIWGQLPANNLSIDGYVGFGANIPNDAIVGVALHEFTHAMGRYDIGPWVLSLFRYKSPSPSTSHSFDVTVPNQNNHVTAPATYFSIDGGNSDLANFGITSDPSDFVNDSLTVNDPFDEHYSAGNTTQSLTSLDRTMLDVLGFSGTQTPTLWIDDASGEIGKLNTETGTVMLVGNSGQILTDIAFNSTGQLFGTSFTALYSINVTTGTANLIGNFNAGAEEMNALAFGGDGTLYATSAGTTQLYSVNTATGLATALSGTLSAASAGDLVLDNGQLYMSDVNGNLEKLTISGTQVSSSVICQLGYTNVFGLAPGLNGDLYGAEGNQILIVDPAIGSVTPTLNYSGHGLGSANGMAELAGTPTGTNAAMLLQNTSSGTLNIWDIGGNSTLASFPLGQIGLEWQLLGVGGFNGTDTSDFIMRQTGTSAIDYFDVVNSQLATAGLMGNIGNEWQVLGFGDFSGNAGETDMLMRNSSNNNIDYFDIQHNQIVAAGSFGNIGMEWQVLGFGDFSGNVGESDLLMRDTANGAIDYFDIQHNRIATAGSFGNIGMEWQVLGFGDFSGNVGESDMLMRDTANGAIDYFDIQHNRIATAGSFGNIGMEWQVAGFADISGSPGESDMVMRDTGSGGFDYFDIQHNQLIAAGSLGSAGTGVHVLGVSPV